MSLFKCLNEHVGFIIRNSDYKAQDASFDPGIFFQLLFSCTQKPMLNTEGGEYIPGMTKKKLYYLAEYVVQVND